MNATGRPAGLRVLVVEDDPDTAESTKLLLGMYGHEVGVATNGIEAVDAVAQADPDVMLLDIGIKGLNGCEVASRVTKQRPQKRPFIIAVTGYGQEEDKRHSAEAGVDLHLVKPVDPELLACLLRRFQQMVLG